MADLLPDFPYRLQNGPGNVPDADFFMADYDHIRDYLNGRLGNLSSGQILIANGSGQVVGRVISGDALITNTGVLSIANDAITAAKIAAGAVGSSEIASNAVQTAELDDDAVTQAKIADNAVGNAQMADSAVGAAELADLGVTGAKIANGTIGGGKLGLSQLSNVRGASDVGIPTSWTDYLSVTPLANATYLVLAQIALGTTGGATNANVRLLVDGAAAITMDEIPLDSLTMIVPIMTVVTPTTTNPIKVQAQREGAAGVTVRADNLTRIQATRIG